MKAIVCRKYGSPDVLKLEEVGKPTVIDSNLLVRIQAAAVNPLDWHLMRGRPYIARLSEGLLRPKSEIWGVDFAGQVEAVGRNVTQFQPGDEVFGARSGAFAEYLAVSENRLAKKPANLTFEQAAAVPVAAITALQALRDWGGIRSGQKVLINGASGGVGTFAVQIAKSFGAEVTGVCSTGNGDMVRSLGADQVIDYTKEDFVKDGRQRYDIMLDNVGNRSLSECRSVLVSSGVLVLNSGNSIARIFKAILSKRFVSRKMVFHLAKINRKDLEFLKELIEAGKVIPVIDRSYPLVQTAEAIRHLEGGHVRGKVVIMVGHDA